MPTPEQLSFLRDFEAELVPQLGDVSLVGEIDYPLSIAEEAWALHLHELHGAAGNGTHARTASFTRRFRVSLTAAIVALCRHYYQDGALWPALRKRLVDQGLRGALSDSAIGVLRPVFTDTLREYGLPVVGDGRRNELVNTAAMHAGIPTSCLADWFTLTGRGRDRVSDDPSALTRWARRSIDESVMNGIDQPVKRLLQVAPEFAEDLFQRGMELVDYLQSQYDSSVIGKLATATTDELASLPADRRAREIGLQARWVMMACQHLIKSGRPQRRLAKRATGAPQPTVRLMPGEDRVEVVLPPIMGVAHDVDWLVDQGDGQESFTARSSPVGGVLATETLRVPLTHATAAVRVTIADVPTTLSLWTEDCPLVVFNDAGRQLSPRTGELPGGSQWLLLPPESTWTVNDKQPRILAESDTPLGWFGWQLVLVTLASGDRATFHGPSFSAAGTSFTVGGKQHPRVELPDPVRGVTSHGWPVIAHRPVVELPPGSASWQVSVTRWGKSDSVWSESGSGGERMEVLHDFPPSAGTYELRVRGPLGRSVREPFVLVDGLGATASPTVRRLDDYGQLASARVLLDAAVGVTIQPVRLEFDHRTRHRIARARSRDGETVRLDVEVPATLVAVGRPKQAIQWVSHPIRVDSRDLHGSDLLAQLPDSSERPELVASCGGVPLQTLSGSTVHGHFKYPLDALGDLAQEYARLDLHLDGQGVGRLIPTRPKVSFDCLEPGNLHLNGDADVVGLEVWAWPAAAPWRRATRLVPASESDFVLPIGLTSVGDLAVHVRPTDDWVEQSDPTSAVPWTLVPASGQLHLSPTERRIREVAFARSASLEPDDVSLAVQILLADAPPPNWPVTTNRQLRSGIAPHATQVLSEVARAGLAPAGLARALIRTGLHTQKLVMNQGEARDLWLTSPILAAIFAPEARPGPEAGSDEHWIHLVADALGEEFPDLLDMATEATNAMGHAEVEPLGTEEHTDPRPDIRDRSLDLAVDGRLDSDARIQYVLSLTRSMDSQTASRFYADLETLTVELRTVLERNGLHEDVAQIDAVMHEGEWMDHHWLAPYLRAVAVVPWKEPRVDHQRLMESAARVAPELLLIELIRRTSASSTPPA